MLFHMGYVVMESLLERSGWDGKCLSGGLYAYLLLDCIRTDASVVFGIL